jgi:hypothetical protein
MKNGSAMRGGLFVFECSRFAYLTMVLIALRPEAAAAFPWLVCAVPNALFPLMLLFLWLDFSRYSVYAPLYKSGKCVCVFSVVGWFVFLPRIKPALSFDPGILHISLATMAVLILIDLVTVIIAALITGKNKRIAKLKMAEAEKIRAAETEITGQED